MQSMNEHLVKLVYRTAHCFADWALLRGCYIAFIDYAYYKYRYKPSVKYPLH